MSGMLIKVFLIRGMPTSIDIMNERVKELELAADVVSEWVDICDLF